MPIHADPVQLARDVLAPFGLPLVEGALEALETSARATGRCVVVDRSGLGCDASLHVEGSPWTIYVASDLSSDAGLRAFGRLLVRAHVATGISGRAARSRSVRDLVESAVTELVAPSCDEDLAQSGAWPSMGA